MNSLQIIYVCVYIFQLHTVSASGLNNVVVVVSDDAPTDAVTKDDFEGDDFKELGSHEGEINEGDVIKVKPDESVPGQFIVIYAPEGDLALGDVKVYVKPAKTPGEPEGPGGPDGPDGPEEVTNPDQETGGSGGEHPENGNDGNPDTCFTAEADDELAPFWSLNLGKEWDIVAVHVVACAEDRKYT